MSRKFALIIGNSDYNDKNLACLKTPAADVRELAEVLLDPKLGGFDEAPTLINESDSTIRKAIERFFAKRKSDDLLLLYFSGHGVLDDQGRLYLAVRDTEYELWSASAIPASFITDNMDRSQSRRQVLILDCCHSGAFFRGTKAVTGAKAVTETTFEGKGYGKVVLTATDTTQYAWEDDQIIGETDNSVFTHFLIEGLKTGVADANSDGQITLDELYDYVYRNLVSATSKQTPRKWAYNQQGEFIIATNPSPVIKPVPLPDELLHATGNTLSYVREGAVRELEQLLGGRNKGLALAAREALERIAADDDSRRVAKLAAEILEQNAEVATPAPAPEPPPQPETDEQEKLKAASRQAEIEKERAEKEKEEERKRIEAEHREREEEQQRTKIAELYSEADAAIAKKDWSAAVDKLNALLVLNPGHTEAAARLKDVLKEIEEAKKRQQKIADLEHEAQAAEDKEDWATVSEKRQALLALEPAHPESIFKVSYAQTQQKLADLYAEGEKSYAAHDWSKALSFFEQAQDLKADYKDVISLIADIQQKIADEAKPEPPAPTEPPPLTEPITPPSSPDSPVREHQPEMFTSFAPVEQGRKLWPLAVGAAVVLMIFIGIIVFRRSSNEPAPSAATHSSPVATPTAVPTIARNMNGSVNGNMATTTSLTHISQVDFNRVPFDVFGGIYKTAESKDEVKDIAYGDLTGDGRDEAAINVRQMPNKNNSDIYQGFVYRLMNGNLELIAKYECPTNGVTFEGEPLTSADFWMANVEIQGGKLKVGCYVYDPTRDKITNIIEIVTYKWDGSKFVQVGKPTRVIDPDAEP